MTAGLAIVAFYMLLAFAVLVMRGDLTNWPREADRAAALVICLSAVALLLRSWTSSRPVAGPAEDGSSRPRPTWMWWAGVVGLVAFVFLAALPPVSEALARPLARQRLLDGRDSPGPAPPPPSPDGTVPNPDASGPAIAEGSGPLRLPGEQENAALSQSLSAGEGEKTTAVPAPPQGLAAIATQWRALMDSRPPWLVAVLVLLAAGAAGLLWWLGRRFFSRPSQPDDGTAPRPPWHNDPDAPAYVREFRRLCENQGCPPRPGDTWRDLLGRLPATPDDFAPLEPVAVYHYCVRYEGAAADPAAERAFARLIRAARKASTFPPAAETTPAASTAR